MPSEVISWGEKGLSPNMVMEVMHQGDREIFYLFTAIKIMDFFLILSIN
jgi:hypothetical protein